MIRRVQLEKNAFEDSLIISKDLNSNKEVTLQCFLLVPARTGVTRPNYKQTYPSFIQWFISIFTQIAAAVAAERSSI